MKKNEHELHLNVKTMMFFFKEPTTVSDARTKSGQVGSSKDSTTVSKAGTKSGQVSSFSKDSTTDFKASTKSGQVSSSKKIVKTVDNGVPAKKETKDFLTLAVVPEKTPKVKTPVETVASPETNGASPVHKENKSLQEETVQDVSCEKNSVLGDCISTSLKRKREQSQDIPSKKRLLEAIPSRGLQPPINVSHMMFTNNSCLFVVYTCNKIACVVYM